MAKFIFTAVLIFASINYANNGILQNRPLRTLKLGTEVYALAGTELVGGNTYQDGGVVLIGYPPFDDKKPFCEIVEFSYSADFKFSKIPLRLDEVAGWIVDNGEGDQWVKFVTQVHFSAPKAKLSVKCFSESKAALKEVSISEFETVFGTHLRFGNLVLGDSGIESESSLDPENWVLTPENLRKYIVLETLAPIQMTLDPNGAGFRATITEGKIVAENDYSTKYCEIRQSPELVDSQSGTEMTIPQGLKLKFSGPVSGSYYRNNHLDFGFALIADLSGFATPLKLYCATLDSNKPFRYSGARYTTYPLLDWIVSQ